MKGGDLAALLHVLAFVAAIGVSVTTKAAVPVSRSVAKPLFWGLFVAGMALFTWALVYLKGAFLGNVEARGDTLVKSGPYRWVRHPLYLGMVVAALGIVLGLRSLWGLLALLLLFVPATVHRARLEEKALARTFGQDWEAYADRTAFLVPVLW